MAAEVQWQIASDSGFTSVVWDTDLREPDGRYLTADTVDFPMGSIALVTNTTYYVRCRVRDDTGTAPVIWMNDAAAGVLMDETYHWIKSPTSTTPGASTSSWSPTITFVTRIEPTAAGWAGGQ